MNLKIFLIIILGSFLLCGCDDKVADHYATRSESEADQLFQRGWLPNIIPESAKNISVLNDLDVNVSEGEFSYDPKVPDNFFKYLKPYSAQKLPKLKWESIISEQIRNDDNAFEYSDGSATWIFLINIKTGHVRYLMWLIKNNS